MSSTELEPKKEVNSQSTPKMDPDDKGTARMTFTSHLGDLRSRMIKAAVAIVVCFFICYYFSEAIIGVMKKPLITDEHVTITDRSNPTGTPAEAPATTGTETDAAPRKIRWMNTTPLEHILVKLKFSAYGAVLLGFPFIVYQIFSFIFPGLKPSERRLVNIMLMGCTSLAVLGALTAFLGVLPLLIPYLLSFTPPENEIIFKESETLSMVFKGILGFAIAFQFPVIVLALVHIGLLEPQTLKEHRRLAVVILFVMAAFLTPPDPISLMIMAMPLVLLYEFSIWASILIVRKKSRNENQ
jgi:sec-independent protein translocase protein TatC